MSDAMTLRQAWAKILPNVERASHTQTVIVGRLCFLSGVQVTVETLVARLVLMPGESSASAGAAILNALTEDLRSFTEETRGIVLDQGKAES